MQDQRRSFSFSSFDFNSSNNSGTLFSSDDDDFFASNFVMYDTDDDDEGAYIEINLNPKPTKTSVLVDDEGGNIKRNFHVEEKDSNSSEVELRISFSSSGIPTTETTSCGTTQHAQGTTTSKPRGRLFVSLARIVNEFMAASSGKTSNSIETNNVDCTEMIRTRKDCTMVASTRNGIMNFIVKFKYKNIPSMLVSMVTPKPKSGQMPARQPLLQRCSSRCRNPMNDNMKIKTRNHSDLNHYQDLNREKSTSSSVAGIINFKAMKGVLDALIVRTSRYYPSARTGTLSANKPNKSKSCPSSIKSSPMHSNIVCDDEVRRFYSRDNSVQAAIAHCKKSFGTQAEFDFHL
ncbi:uncharacterized protein LOC132049835 [Lycium ferocissimum]|uniref:uncharacterized protein LOC132049835 n=1 Tax=Lycium ferocissimum TaxID=112874 RepID=UPI002815CDF3|nr:uncharacterized protein LOC132049835 [Lycium ferocissimum]